MKYLAIMISFLLFIPAVQAQNGSFFITKSTYLFQTSSKKGKKILTREKKAYNVVNIYAPKGDTIMFKIEFDQQKSAINGSGFIVENESELKELGLKEVRVYAEMPTRKSDLTNYQLVPSNQLSFTGREEISQDFPKLTWKAVNYSIEVSSRFWVPEWAGIYRPDKDGDWLNRAYQSALSKKLSEDLIDKILNGQVETGFTKEQVKMALGMPIKEQFIENNTKQEWIYNSRKVIFINNLVSRIL